jgi:protein-S-isoprenylcysteine O-methyltransferase Ste14
VLGTLCVALSAALSCGPAGYSARCVPDGSGLIRHSIYTGTAQLALGGALVAGFGQILLVLPITLAFHGWRVRVEDRLMTATFGNRFRCRTEPASRTTSVVNSCADLLPSRGI